MDTMITVTEEEALKNVRSQVRANLTILRGRLTMMGWLPECAVCRLPARYPEIYEALIPAYSVRGEPIEVRRALITPENCVLIHSGRCYELIHTEEGRRRALRQLTAEVGTDSLAGWLESIAGVLSNGLAVRARQELFGATKESRPHAQSPDPLSSSEESPAAGQNPLKAAGAIQTELLGQRLSGYRTEDGRSYLPFAGLCEALGMNPRVQKRRIKGDPILAQSLAGILLKVRGGEADSWRQIECLDLHVIPYWLNMVRCDQVKEEIREDLIRFKKRSADIAWERSRYHILPEPVAGK